MLETMTGFGMLLAGVAIPATAPPERWVPVGGDGVSFEDYLDRHSVRATGSKVTVWTQRRFMREQGSLWHEIEFDCSARTETLLAYVRDDGGSVTHNKVRPHRGPAPVASGSREERTLDLGCRLGSQAGQQR